MSSSEGSAPTGLRRRLDAGFSRRALLCALGIGVASVGLAGCEGGFKPLYGSLGGNSVEQKMAQVEIAPIPGRGGQRIRNELIFKAYGGDEPAPPRFRLEIAIKETSTTTLVLRDGTSAGQVYQIDAKFQLIDIATKKVLLAGNSQSRATSERYANVYSNVRAGDDAQDRAAKTIAVDLKARIAAFLSTVPT
jgi:LPS-assembly lipoprotein